MNQSDPAEGKFAFKLESHCAVFASLERLYPEQCTTILKMLDQFQDS